MNLIALVQGFMAAKQEQLSEELAEKYGVPVDEVAEIVESFLKDTYGPAEKLAEAIHSKERPVLLFIGRKDCAICQRSLPDLERFLLRPRGFRACEAGLFSPRGSALPHDPQQERRDASLDCHDLPGLNKDGLHRGVRP